MSTHPPPDPTPSSRKKLIGVGVLLGFLVLLLLLALYALGLWSSGKMTAPLIDLGRIRQPMLTPSTSANRFRIGLRRLYYGHQPPAVAFQAGLLALDLAALAYFLATTFVADAPCFARSTCCSACCSCSSFSAGSRLTGTRCTISTMQRP